MEPKAITFLHTFFFENFYAFGLSRNNFFCRKQLGNWGWGFLDYVPLWAPGNLTEPNWHTSHLDNVSNKIRLQLSLWDTHLENVCGQSPLVGPQGSGLDQNCTCTTRPWSQQNLTINRSLQYLITDEIKERDIVYVQTDGRTTKGYRISSTGLRPVELKTVFILIAL